MKTLGGGLYVNKPHRKKDIQLTSIPYYAWENREPGKCAFASISTETIGRHFGRSSFSMT
jgi:hypothetical protein